MEGRVRKVSGPLIEVNGMGQSKMYDVVQVGKDRLTGEIIELRGDIASVQVYEETAGIKVGDLVENTGKPLSLELAPGLIGEVFDGIGRSLKSLYKTQGDRIATGGKATHLDHKKKWHFQPVLNKGDMVGVGDVLGTVPESEIVVHKVMVPQGVKGEIVEIKAGEFTIDDVVAKIEYNGKVTEVCMLQKWPVRMARPYKSKISINEPMITGQRVIDTLFPLARGGVAAVPGPFGSGKTIVQHQLAKWCDAEVVVYIGCGERGNEMTDVLNEFPTLKDPKTGKMLMERTILVANTSDMPVAAREASIYTGITLAEYYRDMGYNVVIMADSTSRWAEALREMSGRLEEMPGEEGYPAYLTSRLAEFYERAGSVKVLGSENKCGSVTAIGAVSPQGGDLSEPVSQATLRIVKVFWGLSSALAYKRHFPAIDWLISYSGYSDKLSKWYEQNVSSEFEDYKKQIMKILQQEAELNDMVQLVGFDVLSDKDKITLDIAQIIREDFLHQNAFDEVDTYTSIGKQNLMLKLIITYANLAYNAVKAGKKYEQIITLDSRAGIGRVKYITEDNLKDIDGLITIMQKQFDELVGGDDQ